MAGPLPRLLVADLDDPGFLQHFAGMRLTPTQEAELVAVLKRLALPMDQIIAQGRASAGAASFNPTTGAPSASAISAAAPMPPLPQGGPPLSFFPPSPEALLMMTGMSLGTTGNGTPKPAPPQPPRPPPPSLSSAAAAAASASAPAEIESGGASELMVLVTLSRDRGGGARLFYPSRLAAPDTEAAFREEVARLMGAWLLPLLETGDGGQLDAAQAAAGLAIEWKPALSYRKTLLRLTGAMPSVVLVRVGDGVEVEGADLPAGFDVLVKGVV